MFEHRTEFQYLRIGSYIYVEKGTKIKKKFFGLIAEEVPEKVLYEIIKKTTEYAPTMDFALKEVDTGEERIITVSPYRRTTYYVKEQF